jgi:glucosamine--fructose-6-phosphate aminotransferase (isomerizing)
MCGIFAYIGNRQVLELLLKALQRLEYRGYDSAGVGIHQESHIKIQKKIGKVANLATACGGYSNPEYKGTAGLSHTRWATHGRPSDENSHPHFSADRSIVVVHNGIIENYASLKQDLKNKGYVFTSETDTELLAHLVADVRKELGPGASWAVVVSSALALVTGTYGLVFMFKDDSDLLIGARKGSPLLLGVADGEYYLASDGSAIVEHTKDVVYLRDGELVEIRRGGYRIRNIETLGANQMSIDEYVSNPLCKLELSLEQIEKGGYKHFMLKEIIDQPNSIKNTIRGRLYEVSASVCGHDLCDAQVGSETPLFKQVSPQIAALDPTLTPNAAAIQSRYGIRLGGLMQTVRVSGKTALETIAGARKIIIVACGTSWHSGLIGEYLIEQFARVNVEVEYASEFRYRNPLISSEDVIIAISQSGETADTLEAIRIAKKFGATTIGIVNVVGSTIARETDAGIYLHAGPEIGVASTKAFTAQVMVLTLLALRIAVQRKTISEEIFNHIAEQMNELPLYIAHVIESTAPQVKKISKYFRHAQNFLFLGRGIHFPVALEAALKLKEISYIHAEGYPAAEMKHGPIALIDHMMPVVVIAPKSDPIYDKIRANIEEVKARNGELIIITEEDNHELDSFAADEQFVIRVPTVDSALQPLVTIVPLQLLSYYVADLRGCSIDQPRNLAKSVTVE